MSKLILLACPVMNGVRLRNETRQGSSKKKKRKRCLLLKNLMIEFKGIKSHMATL